MSRQADWVRRPNTSVIILCSALGIAAYVGLAVAAPNDSDQSADDMVKEALHRELYGFHAERDQLLSDAARQAPNYGPAQWHRGFVREGTSWQSVDELIRQDRQTPTQKEYLHKRKSLKDTVDGHLALANWSRDSKLTLQERAHLSRILDLNPEHAVARDRLGFVRTSGEWVTRTEIRAREDRAAKERAAEQKWLPTLREVRCKLAADASQHRQVARERLHQIKDPFVIPALESTLSTTNEEAALAVVDLLASMPGQEAVDGLIRHAMFSQWPLVRETAAEGLQARPRESFVPTLIEEMFTTTTTQFRVNVLPNGRLGYRHVMQREGIDDKEVLVLDTEYARRQVAGGNGQETLARAFLDSVVGVAQREVAVTRQNFVQTTINQRLTDTLNIATKSQLPADPKRWWQWWDEENDVVQLSEKQIRQRQQVRFVSVQDRRPQREQSSQSDRNAQTDGNVQTVPVGQWARRGMIQVPFRGFTGFAGNRFRRAECFVAGTPVLTRRGLVNIEKVQIGDLVLSQQVDTGELAFKPVLRTTVRPPEKLVKLLVGRDTFEISQGHLFWVAGHGWNQARKLDSGMQLHCLKKSLPVNSVEEGSHAETYNLIVDDFHTYFVGDEFVLTHDVTNRQPTAAIMPGLTRAD